MTQRDKKTLLYLFGGLGALVALIFAVYTWYVAPLQRYNGQIANLNDDIFKADMAVRLLDKDKDQLKAYYKYLSLPQSPDKAATEYAKFLHPLLEQSGLTVDGFNGPPQGEMKAPAAVAGSDKKALHQKLTFTVRAHGTLDSLAVALTKMQAAPLAHRIKSMTLTRPDAKDPSKLNVQLTVEALIVHKAQPRDSYIAPDQRLAVLDAVAGRLGGPIGLNMMLWAAGPLGPRGGDLLVSKEFARDYNDIGRKNIFIGYVPPLVTKPTPVPPTPVVEDDEFDMRSQIRLVSTDPINKEAFLRNYAVKAPEMRLRPKAGFDTFKVMNENQTRTLVQAKVIRIDQRDVYFIAKDAELGAHLIYGLHIGDTLKQAMDRPLSDPELEERGLMEFLPKEEKTKDTEKKGKKNKL